MANAVEEPLSAARTERDGSTFMASRALQRALTPPETPQTSPRERLWAKGISRAPRRREMNWQMEGDGDQGVFINIT